MLKLTANRETVNHRASEQAEFARTVEISQSYITNESVMDGSSRHSQSSILQSDLNDHVKIGPVTRIEVFESARVLLIEVQVPSRQPEHVKSRERISRGIEQFARQHIPKDTEHQNSGGVRSPQSSSCGRPRALTQSEQSPVKYKATSRSFFRLDSVNEIGK